MTKVVSVRVSDIRPKYKDLEDWMGNPDNVYIGRKGIVFITGFEGEKYRYPKTDSMWANPYKISDSCDRNECIRLYKEYIVDKMEKGIITRSQLMGLKNKTLGCWCKTKKEPNTPCHGDILIELINSIE